MLFNAEQMECRFWAGKMSVLRRFIRHLTAGKIDQHVFGLQAGVPAMLTHDGLFTDEWYTAGKYKDNNDYLT
jgi:hypothetical protein